MDFNDFVRLKKQVAKDLQINNENVLQKSLELPSLFTRYLNILTNLSYKLNRKKKEQSSLFHKLYHYYKFEYKYELRNKGEIEAYIHGNKDYISISNVVEDLELMCEFLEKTLANIRQISFTIKNYVELRRFESGD